MKIIDFSSVRRYNHSISILVGKGLYPAGKSKEEKGLNRVKRRIFSMLLVLLTVFSLGSTAMAVEDSSAKNPQMSLAWDRSGTTITLTASLTAPGTTNGRMVLTYDPDVLVLQSAAAGSAKWVSSIDSETLGEVAFAWVGSELTSAQTKMLTLTFAAPKVDFSTTVTSAMTELYDGGTALTLPASASALIRVTYIAPNPNPGTPATPTTPDEGDGDGDKRENPFTDITGHWAEQEILDAYYAGLVNGLGNGLFGPDMALDRGMFATLLYRLAGSPAVTGTNPFADVPAGEYYEKAVIWAYENGVVTGTSATTFAPKATLTREQMVTMLYRYAAFAGLDTTASASLASFTDASSVSDYAVTAMQWAVAGEIIKGQGSALVPAGTTTRAQAAAVLVRFAG